MTTDLAGASPVDQPVRRYPLSVENVGEDTYILMSKGHHDVHEFMRATPFIRYGKLHRFTRHYVETIRVETHLVIHANGNCAIDRKPDSAASCSL